MRTLTLAEVNEMGDGETVPAVEGTIAKVYERKTGTHKEYGEWSIQNTLFVDGEHKEFVNFRNMDDVSQWEGVKVRLECYKGKKGMAGIKVEERDVPDKDNPGQTKKYRSLNCTVNPKKLGDTPAKKAAVKSSKTGPTKKDVEEYIDRIGKLRAICEAKGAEIVAQVYPDGFDWSDPHQSEKATTISSGLFIQATRHFNL